MNERIEAIGQGANIGSARHNVQVSHRLSVRIMRPNVDVAVLVSRWVRRSREW